MKSLVLIFSLISCNIAFALSSSSLTQILQDKEILKLTAGTSITKIEQTAVFRCLGCFEVVITQQTPVGPQEIKLTTQAIGPNKIAVKVKSVTK